MFFNGHVFHQRVIGKKNTFTYPYPAEFFSDIYCFKTKTFKNDFLNLFPKFIETVHHDLEDHLDSCAQLFQKKYDNISLNFLALPNSSMLIRFNPVRFFFVILRDECIGLIADVTNTFGEKRAYFVHNSGNSIEQTILNCSKDMYVSPFNKKSGKYEFRYSFQEQKLRINIDQFYNDRLIVKTSLFGILSPNRSLLHSAKFILHSLLVTPRIHWQALKLLIKKHTIYPHGETGYHNENS